MSLRACCLMGLALMVPASSWADPVTVLNVGRFAISGASVGPGPAGSTSDTQRDADSLVSTSTFSTPEGTATATSTLLTTTSAAERSFSGSGSVRASQETTTFFSGAGAQISYLVDFELSQPQQFDFTGSFTSTGRVTDSMYAYWSAVIFVAPATRDGIRFLDINGFDSADRTMHGVLPAGHYGFSVDAVANTNTAGTFSSEARHTFSLRFSDANGASPTPEPGSMVLFGTGLAAFAGMVRRRIGRDASHL